MDYRAKLAAYSDLAEEYLDTERYQQWCAEHLPHLDEQVLEWVSSTDFDRVLKETVVATYPPHEHHHFLDYFHGLVDQWIVDEARRLRVPQHLSLIHI